MRGSRHDGASITSRTAWAQGKIPQLRVLTCSALQKVPDVKGPGYPDDPRDGHVPDRTLQTGSGMGNTAAGGWGVHADFLWRGRMF